MNIKPRHSGRFGTDVAEPTPESNVIDPAQDTNLPINADDTPAEPNIDIVPASNEANTAPASEPTETDSVEIDESKFLEFYKKRTGREISDFSELEKPENPAPSYDKETQKFLQFQKVKGGTMQDWIELNKDWKEVGDVDILRVQMKEEYGSNLSKSEIDALIKDKYDIDEMDDFSDLEGVSLAKLKADANKYRKQKISSREEVLKSLEDTSAPEKDSQPDSEMVTLSNGMQVSRQEYLAQRQEYEQGRAAAIESLDQASFSFKMTTQDGDREVKLDYLYTKEDKQKMLSKSEDTSRILQEFIDDQNKLKHGEFNEGLLWADKKHRETVLIPRLLSQAFSMGIDNEIAEERNVNFDTPRPVTTSGNKRQVDVSRIPGRQMFGPRFTLNKKK